MKRGKTEPILDDVEVCVQMGWTWEELQRQPAGFVEKLRIYLGAIADKQIREQERFDDELRRLERMRA